MSQTFLNPALSMTSREIADLTGKQHPHILRDIRTMITRLEADPNLDWHCESESYVDVQGKKRTQYRLDKLTTLTLVSGYDPVLRMRIIARWQELEAQQTATASPPFSPPATVFFPPSPVTPLIERVCAKGELLKTSVHIIPSPECKP